MIIVDTGFWIALVSSKDSYPHRAVTALKAVSEGLITTLPVVTETCYLLQTKIGWQAEVHFIRSLDSGLAQIASFDEDCLEVIAKLMCK